MTDPEGTIAAIATPPGEGGIGVLRLSGPDAEEALDSLLGTPLEDPEPRRAYLRPLGRPDEKDSLDQGLVTVFPAPRSYTGEDVVEISCHGSPLLLQTLLDGLLDVRGVRLAEPGEFTRRAFENGKLDLAQADAVASLIAARSEAALKASARQLEGELSEAVDSLRETLVWARSRVEATLDFGDQESVGKLPREELDERLEEVQEDLTELIQQGQRGTLLEQGCRTVIVGRPNVGKSSLLNRLLQSDRAIVTEQPGTTRDVVSDRVELEGIPFQLQDTAGIRTDPDRVEAEGIRRSEQALQEADLVLFMVDHSQPLSDEDRAIHGRLDGQTSLLVSNKHDLDERLSPETLREAFDRPVDCRISALTGKGLDELKTAMVRAVTGGEATIGDPLVTQTRHLRALKECLENLRRAREGLTEQRDAVMVAQDLRDAGDELGAITGAITTDELLDRIFSTFCIGK